MLNQDNNLSTKALSGPGRLCSAQHSWVSRACKNTLVSLPKGFLAHFGRDPFAAETRGVRLQRAPASATPRQTRLVHRHSEVSFPQCGAAASTRLESGLLPWPEPAAGAAGRLNPH